MARAHSTACVAASGAASSSFDFAIRMTTPTTGARDIEVRPLRGTAEYSACVRLQHDTWGAAFTDVVPASILQVSQKIGGVAAGAFNADGELVGFVFGLTGVLGGRLVHWSDMLAVRPEYRNQGVGQQLKQHQREVVRELGVQVMHWTFDPLVARNAHLNLNRLGARVSEYVVDMYGADTGSALHAAGTDRFIVSWPVSGAAAPPVDDPAWRHAALAAEHEDAAVQRVQIPADVTAVPVAEARRYRATTRAAFTRLLRARYEIVGFYCDDDGHGNYVLEKC